jgi:hypothetical protein
MPRKLRGKPVPHFPSPRGTLNVAP